MFLSAERVKNETLKFELRITNWTVLRLFEKVVGKFKIIPLGRRSTVPIPDLTLSGKQYCEPFRIRESET